MYDAEDPNGALHNIVNGDRDRFDKFGIILEPDNKPADLVNNQDVIDKEHGEVSKAAKHALHSK